MIEFQQSALVYMGVDCETVGSDVRVRRAISLAIDRQALVDARPRRARLARVLADPLALAVVRAGGRGVRRPRPAGGGASCSTRPASRRARTASGSSWRRWSSNDAAVRRVAETIREQLAAVGVRLVLEVIPAFDEFYGRLNEHPPAFISKWFWPEPVDAIVGFIATWGQDGGPNFQRSSDEALDRACRAWELGRDDDALRAAARATSSCARPSACR